MENLTNYLFGNRTINERKRLSYKVLERTAVLYITDVKYKTEQDSDDDEQYEINSFELTFEDEKLSYVFVLNVDIKIDVVAKRQKTDSIDVYSDDVSDLSKFNIIFDNNKLAEIIAQKASDVIILYNEQLIPLKNNISAKIQDYIESEV